MNELSESKISLFHHLSIFKMIRIDAILEENESIKEYLLSRQILEQYKKAKTMLVS
jgi:hypothetical protein